MTERDGRNDRPKGLGDGRHSNSPPVRAGDSRPGRATVDPEALADDQPEGGGSVALASRSVAVETDRVVATLVDIPLVDVRDIVYEHQLDPSRLDSGETTQPVALFDLHNVGRQPLTWTSSRTQFVGDDGYTYSPAQLSVDPGELGPGIHTRRVEVRPDRRARVATLVEQLPPGVTVTEVVQQVGTPGGAGESDQLVFSLG